MSAFFPRQNVAWNLEEPRAIRRLTLSLLAMAALAGIISRLLHLALIRGPTLSWWVVLGGLAFGVIIILAFATAHLGNYPIKQWLWRAPLFGLVEGLAEAATSAALIGAGIERLGTDQAHWHHWPGIAIDTTIGTPGLAFLDGRIIMVSMFALLLAGVVQLVRFALLEREHRDTTAVAIHEEHVKQVEEQESARSAGE
jgi:hypothetical protein